MIPNYLDVGDSSFFWGLLWMRIGLKLIMMVLWWSMVEGCISNWVTVHLRNGAGYWIHIYLAKRTMWQTCPKNIRLVFDRNTHGPLDIATSVSITGTQKNVMVLTTLILPLYKTSKKAKCNI
jgi:hypothetical protein